MFTFMEDRRGEVGGVMSVSLVDEETLHLSLLLNETHAYIATTLHSPVNIQMKQHLWKASQTSLFMSPIPSNNNNASATMMSKDSKQNDQNHQLPEDYTRSLFTEDQVHFLSLSPSMPMINASPTTTTEAAAKDHFKHHLLNTSPSFTDLLLGRSYSNVSNQSPIQLRYHVPRQALFHRDQVFSQITSTRIVYLVIRWLRLRPTFSALLVLYESLLYGDPHTFTHGEDHVLDLNQRLVVVIDRAIKTCIFQQWMARCRLRRRADMYYRRQALHRAISTLDERLLFRKLLRKDKKVDRYYQRLLLSRSTKQYFKWCANSAIVSLRMKQATCYHARHYFRMWRQRYVSKRYNQKLLEINVPGCGVKLGADPRTRRAFLLLRKARESTVLREAAASSAAYKLDRFRFRQVLTQWVWRTEVLVGMRRRSETSNGGALLTPAVLRIDNNLAGNNSYNHTFLRRLPVDPRLMRLLSVWRSHVMFTRRLRADTQLATSTSHQRLLESCRDVLRGWASRLFLRKKHMNVKRRRPLLRGLRAWKSAMVKSRGRRHLQWSVFEAFVRAFRYSKLSVILRQAQTREVSSVFARLLSHTQDSQRRRSRVEGLVGLSLQTTAMAAWRAVWTASCHHRVYTGWRVLTRLRERHQDALSWCLLVSSSLIAGQTRRRRVALDRAMVALRLRVLSAALAHEAAHKAARRAAEGALRRLRELCGRRQRARTRARLLDCVPVHQPRTSAAYMLSRDVRSNRTQAHPHVLLEEQEEDTYVAGSELGSAATLSEHTVELVRITRYHSRRNIVRTTKYFERWKTRHNQHKHLRQHQLQCIAAASSAGGKRSRLELTSTTMSSEAVMTRCYVEKWNAHCREVRAIKTRADNFHVHSMFTRLFSRIRQRQLVMSGRTQEAVGCGALLVPYLALWRKRCQTLSRLTYLETVRMGEVHCMRRQGKLLMRRWFRLSRRHSCDRSKQAVAKCAHLDRLVCMVMIELKSSILIAH